MTNTKDEYISAKDLGNSLFGALVFIAPALRSKFIETYPDIPVPLTEVFRVTNLQQQSCSILYRDKVYSVDPALLLTKNPDHKLY